MTLGGLDGTVVVFQTATVSRPQSSEKNGKKMNVAGVVMGLISLRDAG